MKAICCKKCKKEDMVNLKDKLCPCGKRAYFGSPVEKIALYCKNCKLNDMINLKDAKC